MVVADARAEAMALAMAECEKLGGHGESQ